MGGTHGRGKPLTLVISWPALIIFATEVRKKQDIPFADSCDEGPPQIRFSSLGLAISLGHLLPHCIRFRMRARSDVFFPICSVLACLGPMFSAMSSLWPVWARCFQRCLLYGLFGPDVFLWLFWQISSALLISLGPIVSHEE
jgi:hypothetical protein